MSKYRIINAISAVELGIFDADSPAAALDAMARDAGYEDHADAETVAPSKPGEVLVEEVIDHLARILERFGEPPEGAVAWKYADPVDGARWLFDRERADEIARDDQNLIVWLT